MAKSNKDYLGDGVYADFRHGQIILTTEDGIQTTNTIYLDHEVFTALREYANRMTQPVAESAKKK